MQSIFRFNSTNLILKFRSQVMLMLTTMKKTVKMRKMILVSELDLMYVTNESNISGDITIK